MRKKWFLTISALLSLGVSANQFPKFNELVEQKGAIHRVNPNLIRSIISVESAGRLNATSSKGALGIMQLMPATAERMGIPRNQLFDPERNMEAGVRYLAYLNSLFNYDPILVAAAYNAGEGAVKKYGGIPPYQETQRYVPSVMARFKLLNACGVSCYTVQHMRSPLVFLNTFGGTNTNQLAKYSQQKTGQKFATDQSKYSKKNSFVQNVNHIEQSTEQGQKQSEYIEAEHSNYVASEISNKTQATKSGFVKTLVNNETYRVLN